MVDHTERSPTQRIGFYLTVHPGVKIHDRNSKAHPGNSYSCSPMSQEEAIVYFGRHLGVIFTTVDNGRPAAALRQVYPEIRRSETELFFYSGPEDFLLDQPRTIKGGGPGGETASTVLPGNYPGPVAISHGLYLSRPDGWVIFPTLEIGETAAAGACREDVGGYPNVLLINAEAAPEGTKWYQTAEEWLFPEPFSEADDVGSVSPLSPNPPVLGSISIGRFEPVSVSIGRFEPVEISDGAVPQIPDQVAAPVRVTERDGIIGLAEPVVSPLAEADEFFEQWRRPMLRMSRDILQTDFPEGTNQRRVRARLQMLITFFEMPLAELKGQQIDFGLEIERFVACVRVFHTDVDDVHAVAADVLADLDILARQLKVGLKKIPQWISFRKDAELFTLGLAKEEVEQLPANIAHIARAAAKQPAVFDMRLPIRLHRLSDELIDNPHPSPSAVYGAVQSIKNVLIGTAKASLDDIKASSQKGMKDLASPKSASMKKSRLALLRVGLKYLGSLLPDDLAFLKEAIDFIADHMK